MEEGAQIVAALGVNENVQAAGPGITNSAVVEPVVSMTISAESVASLLRNVEDIERRQCQDMTSWYRFDDAKTDDAKTSVSVEKKWW